MELSLLRKFSISKNLNSFLNKTKNPAKVAGFFVSNTIIK